MRRRAVAAVTLACFLAGPAPSTALAGAKPEHAQRQALLAEDLPLEIVGPDVLQPKVPLDDREAWDGAFALSYEQREDFGYPWIDPGHTIRLRPVNGRGAAAADALRSAVDSRVDIEVEVGDASIAELEGLADSLTHLNGTDVPGSDLIWMTEPDYMSNRIIVTIGEGRGDLMSALAHRFGATRLAVRIAPIPRVGTAGRNNDYPPFFGGAKISAPNGGCTTAYGWTAGTAEAMVFAGHCAPNGGSVGYTSFPNVGAVGSGREENWSTTIGTHYLTNQSVYRGDIGLIRYSTLSSSNRVYDGAVNTSDVSIVAGMPSGWNMPNDQACANGAYSGEHCGGISHVGVNIQYTIDGPNVWARNVALLDPWDDNCVIGGDSGGPVYRRRSDGRLTAVGIISGFWQIPGCYIVFTDIRHAYYGFPGTFKTG